jgi:glycosyltransferase involved in cell wall biosynthesis
MKILIVNNLYPPHSRGGAESAVANEARSLAALGHEVSVLTTAPFVGWRSLAASEWKEDGIRIFRFFPLNFFWYRNDYKHNAFVRLLWYVGNLWGPHPVAVFKKVVKSVKPDAIHLHNINGISYNLPHICDKLKIPTVFTVHAVHYVVPSGIIIRGQKLSAWFRLFASLLRRKLHSEATITAPSQWLLDFYVERGFFKGQKMVVVVNPLSISWDRRASPEAARDDGNNVIANPSLSRVKQSLPRFLYVGQIESYKGINLMLAALARLPDDMRWQLDIVGDGSMMPLLRRQRDQHVSLRGKLPPEDVIRTYANATVLIVPSLCEENAPMVIAEAASQGLPAVAAAIGGIPEMVKDGENGLLFEPGNADDLALQLRRIDEHSEILEPMRKKAIESAARYAPDKVTGEYLKLMEK